MNCKTCNKELVGQQKSYCSKRCSNHDTNKRLKGYKQQSDKATKLKLKCVMDKGGKCCRCGYDKNLSALHFHHLHSKLFVIDSRHLANTKSSLIEAELEKCILLCANCHAEEHYPQMAF